MPLLVGITMYRVMSDTMDQFAFSKRPAKCQAITERKRIVG